MLALQPEVHLQEDRWSILNNSRSPQTDPVLARYTTLIAALDAGWRVEPPIYLRADWSLATKSSQVFHFVLHRDSLRMTTLLSVPDCDSVRRLIDDNGWQISSDGRWRRALRAKLAWCRKIHRPRLIRREVAD